MPVFKILIMGLPASGKTTFIRHAFEGDQSFNTKDYRPTFGVHISLHDYKGLEQVKVSCFDCGGQTSFIDTYLTDQWVPKLFEEASTFLFLVDSSSKENLKKANELFHKYLENVIKHSLDTVVYVLASKWDKHVITKDEIQKVFKDMEIHPISVLDGSALRVTQKIMENLSKKKVMGK